MLLRFYFFFYFYSDTLLTGILKRILKKNKRHYPRMQLLEFYRQKGNMTM